MEKSYFYLFIKCLLVLFFVLKFSLLGSGIGLVEMFFKWVLRYKLSLGWFIEVCSFIVNENKIYECF